MKDSARSLDELLAAARGAEPTDRILLREPIAAYAETAIEAMVDWAADPRLAAFAVRVLERIGREPSQRASVVALLSALDHTQMRNHHIADLNRALEGLGGPRRVRPRSAGGGTTTRLRGRHGLTGRGYWVMRTSPWERPFIWAESQAGRLRQGWGVEDEQNLEVIAATLRRGAELSPLQREARLALRMLTSWDNGMRFGDLVVAANLPEYGRLSVFRVVDSYAWAPTPPMRFGERFGHVLPVELLSADIDRNGPDVSDSLRAALRGMSRLYNITGYGGDVETLVGGDASSDRWGRTVDRDGVRDALRTVST